MAALILSHCSVMCYDEYVTHNYESFLSIGLSESESLKQVSKLTTAIDKKIT